MLGKICEAEGDSGRISAHAVVVLLNLRTNDLWTTAGKTLRPFICIKSMPMHENIISAQVLTLFISATCEVSGQLQQNVIVQLPLVETYGSMSARQISSQTGQRPDPRTAVHLTENNSVLIILHDIFTV